MKSKEVNTSPQKGIVLAGESKLYMSVVRTTTTTTTTTTTGCSYSTMRVICRVNPVGYNETISPQTFQGRNDSSPSHLPELLTQKDVWNRLRESLVKPRLSVWLVGGAGSGKSHSLIGSEEGENKGLLYRTLEYIFNLEPTQDTFSLLTMAIIDSEENIVNVLDSCSIHSYQGNIGDSDRLGTMLLPIAPTTCSSFESSVDILKMGLLSAAVYLANTSNVYSRSHLIIQFSSSHRTDPTKGDSSFSTIRFIETSSLHCARPTKPCVDRLTGTSTLNASAVALRNMIATASIDKHASILSYLLEESLTSNENIIIGCLRSGLGRYEENATTLDFINTVCYISSRIAPQSLTTKQSSLHEVIEGLREEARLCENDSVKQSQSTPSTSPLPPPWHSSVTSSAFLTRKVAYLKACILALRKPEVSSIRSTREIGMLLQWLTQQHISVPSELRLKFYRDQFAGKSMRNLSQKSEKFNIEGRSESPRGQSSRMGLPTPKTALNSPLSPYLIPIFPQGSSFPRVCYTIPPGNNLICGGPLFKRISIEGSQKLACGLGSEETEDLERENKRSVIRIRGIGIDDHCHCVLLRTGDGRTLYIEPQTSRLVDGLLLEVSLNGAPVIAKTLLQHDDVILIGVSYFMQIKIPSGPNKFWSDEHKEQMILEDGTNLSFWERLLIDLAQSRIESALKESSTRVTQLESENKTTSDSLQSLLEKHSDQAKSTEDGSRTEPSLSVYISRVSPECMIRMAEMQCAISITTVWSGQLLRDRTKLRLSLKVIEIIKSPDPLHPLFNLPQEGFHYRLDSGAVVVMQGVVECACGSGSWAWDENVFMSRFSVIQDRIFDLDYRCEGSPLLLDDIYPAYMDPFKDANDDELVGVSAVFLGSLPYLMDVSEAIPLISYRGYESGLVQLHIRAMIHNYPAELKNNFNVDREFHLRDQIGKELIIRIIIQSVFSIPEKTSANVFVQFKFYHHRGVYRSTRHPGQSTSPRMDADIVVKQEITPDFIDYLQEQALDIEVWARRETDASACKVITSHLVVGEVDSGSVTSSTTDANKFEVTPKVVQKMQVQLESYKLQLMDNQERLHIANETAERFNRDIIKLQANLEEKQSIIDAMELKAAIAAVASDHVVEEEAEEKHQGSRFLRRLSTKNILQQGARNLRASLRRMSIGRTKIVHHTVTGFKKT